MRQWIVAFAVVALLSGQAWAHPGFGAPSFAGGLAHPVSGADHVLAMLAVGVWASQICGRARWALPLAFVGVMAAGGALGMSGVAMPLVEAGIAGSVVVLGLLVACAARWPLLAAAPLVAAFALFHGHAHGTELPATASATGYVAGFVIATALLHGAGLWLGHAASSRGRSMALRVAGAAIALCGVAIGLA
ncbi:MAG: hypothetical protein HMLKMBBP_00557 [Planctomycetes bacterium]|nr:hypothetical protein [Planctomycetota bacterium]